MAEEREGPLSGWAERQAEIAEALGREAAEKRRPALVTPEKRPKSLALAPCAFGLAILSDGTSYVVPADGPVPPHQWLYRLIHPGFQSDTFGCC